MVTRIRTTEPLTRRNFMLFEGDYEKLQRIYPNVSASAIVRQLIRTVITRHEIAAQKTQTPLEIEVPEDVIAELRSSED